MTNTNSASKTISNSKIFTLILLNYPITPNNANIPKNIAIVKNIANTMTTSAIVNSVEKVIICNINVDHFSFSSGRLVNMNNTIVINIQLHMKK